MITYTMDIHDALFFIGLSGGIETIDLAINGGKSIDWDVNGRRLRAMKDRIIFAFRRNAAPKERFIIPDRLIGSTQLEGLTVTCDGVIKSIMPDDDMQQAYSNAKADILTGSDTEMTLYTKRYMYVITRASIIIFNRMRQTDTHDDRSARLNEIVTIINWGRGNINCPELLTPIIPPPMIGPVISDDVMPRSYSLSAPIESH